MFYPTGKFPEGKLVICMNDSRDEIDEALKSCETCCMVDCLDEWLEENNCCVEEWQVKEYLKNKGLSESEINEDLSAVGGAPFSGAATTANVSGMGNPATPQNDGTNSGFYNDSLKGSGDKFPSLSAGTPSAKKKKGDRKKAISSYLDFINQKKK
jgi:hypothetical protein